MSFLDFCLAVTLAFDNQNRIAHHQSEVNQFFLNELDKLSTRDETDSYLKTTQASILFEGFYRHLDNNDLKRVLTEVKAKRWNQHFGTPTITFLLTYKNQIDQTKRLFDEFSSIEESELDAPWLVSKNNSFVIDNGNGVFADPSSISRVVAPPSREITGIFTKTHNPFGGFTTTPCDPVSQKFIEHAVFAAQSGGKVLEIGAAFS